MESLSVPCWCDARRNIFQPQNLLNNTFPSFIEEPFQLCWDQCCEDSMESMNIPFFFTVWGLKYQVLYVTLVHKDLGGPSYHSISEQLRFHCAVLSGMLDQPFLSNTLQDNGWSYPHSDWVCLFLLNRFRVDGRFIYACLFPRGFNTVHRSFFWELLKLRIEIQTFHILSSK